MRIQLPVEPSANERLLAGWTEESFTGLTGDTVTLTHPAVAGQVTVVYNGVVLEAAHAAWGFSVGGTTVTLGWTLVAEDVVTVRYLARGN